MADQINPYEIKTTDAVLAEFNVQEASGLTNAQVKANQENYGMNEVPLRKQSIVLAFLKHFWGLTAFMLEFTIITSYLLHNYINVYLISGLMIFNSVIGFVQELKAAKTVKSLQKSLQVFARVFRNQKWLELAGNQLVPGDIIRIRTGDFLTADSKLITGNAGADQSALTGESKLINKNIGNILYGGSIIKNGECTAVVVATGINTFFGKTAQLVQKARPRLHMEEVVSNIVKILFSIVLIALAITITISLIRGETFLLILPLMLILLISAVPIALPAMFTVSMTRGSQQLAAKGILVSRLSATEDAATLTTLCIDKTGTLTQNKLSVEQVVAAETFTTEIVLRYAVLASVTANNDPIDMAFIKKAADEKIEMMGLTQKSFTPFNAESKRTEAIVEKNGSLFKVVKGAYNTIKGLCIVQPTNLDKTVEIWAAKGFRTIAVAVIRDNITTMTGIVALIDPPIADSAKMITRIKELGVNVKMLTGDALPIAKEIAIEVGIGQDIALASLFRNVQSPEKIHDLIIAHQGFAEVLPEDKFNIVKALQQYHEITGMTGDGVNDAPALKQAEVGIAVMNATNVAQEAASVVLLHEGLENIISLIIVGRTIHHRITNWVVSKISGTLFKVIFICTAYIIYGQFVVSAFDMIFLLFIVDFVSLTLSTDKVSSSIKPESWKIRPLAKKGAIIGLLNTIEAFGWLFIGNTYWGIKSISELHSFGFLILFFTGIFNIIIIRTPGRFYLQPIGNILLISIIADMTIVICLLTSGLAGFVKLSPMIICASLLYFIICSFLINDWLKVKIN
jgi:H+-transporting ATPase